LLAATPSPEDRAMSARAPTVDTIMAASPELTRHAEERASVAAVPMAAVVVVGPTVEEAGTTNRAGSSRAANPTKRGVPYAASE
ncbi:MAG: hypothetical protein WBR14_16035, partial [Candidatus Acidiferrum sp.]